MSARLTTGTTAPAFTLPDQNGAFEDGFFPLTVNVTETRVSAAIGYLDTETRRRPNLTISTDTQVMAFGSSPRVDPFWFANSRSAPATFSGRSRLRYANRATLS